MHRATSCPTYTRGAHPHAHLPAAGCRHSSQPSCMACSGSAGVNPSTLGWLALSWGQGQPLACIPSVSGREKIHLAIHWEDVSWPMKESRMQVGCNSLRNNKSKGQRNNKSKDKGSTSDNAVSLVQEDWGFLSKLEKFLHSPSLSKNWCPWGSKIS